MQQDNLNKFLNLEINKSKPAMANNLDVEFGNKVYKESKKNYKT